MIKRTRLRLVPFVLGATAMVLFVLTGCRDEVKAPAEKPPQPALSRLNDPAYRAAMTNEVAVRKLLLSKRTKLQRALEQAEASGNAAEATSISNRIVEINKAIDDVRRHMLKTIRTYMTNGTQRAVK